MTLVSLSQLIGGIFSKQNPLTSITCSDSSFSFESTEANDTKEYAGQYDFTPKYFNSCQDI